MSLWFDEPTRERLQKDGYTIELIPEIRLDHLMIGSKEKYAIEFRVNPEDDRFDWKDVEHCQFPTHQIAWKPEMIANSIGMLDWVELKLDECKKMAPAGTRAVIPSAEDCAYLLLISFLRTGTRFLGNFEGLCCKNRYSTEWWLSIDTYFVGSGNFVQLCRTHKTNNVGGLLNYLVPYRG